MSKKGNIWSYPPHFRPSILSEKDDYLSPGVQEANNIDLFAESDHQVPMMVDNNINLPAPTQSDNLCAESDKVPIMVDNGINPPPPAAAESESDQLPVIDIQHLDDEILKEACRKWGLFRVVNHGIPSQLMEELMATAKKLFDLPFEIKQKLLCDANSISKSLVYFWGTPALTPFGTELPRHASRVDWVEGFNALVTRLLLSYSDSATVANSINNIPTSSIISDFSKLLKDYGEHTTRVAKTLFEAMAKNLNMDKQHEGNSLWYHKYLDESTGSFRVYRYPPKTTCTSTGTSNIINNFKAGLNDHTDSSLISILNQDEVGGLEYLKEEEEEEDNLGGLWVGVKPVPNTLIVNLGDMMQAISGDEYKSVRHRVRLNSNAERLSICYFVFPGDNTYITSLNGNYRPFTYNQFRSMVQSDIATYGWKMLGLQHFKN